MQNRRPPIWQPNRWFKQAAACCNRQLPVELGGCLLQTGGHRFDRLFGCQIGGHLFETGFDLLCIWSTVRCHGILKMLYKQAHADYNRRLLITTGGRRLQQTANDLKQVAICLVKSWHRNPKQMFKSATV